MNVKNIEAYPGSEESMFSATGGMGPTATTVLAYSEGHLDSGNLFSSW